MLEHEDVLQLGEIRPLYPHLLYPLVSAVNEKKLVIAWYAEMLFHLDDAEIPENLYLVNGSYASAVLLQLEDDLGTFDYEVTDCCGKVLKNGEKVLTAGVHQLPLPPAAHMHLRKK